ncbi:MAG: hypothetical protein ACK55Z_04410, partial [bacterium]
MPTYIGMKYKTHAHASKGGSDLGELRVVVNKRFARYPQRLLKLPHLLLIYVLPAGLWHAQIMLLFLLLL